MLGSLTGWELFGLIFFNKPLFELGEFAGDRGASQAAFL